MAVLYCGAPKADCYGQTPHVDLAFLRPGVDVYKMLDGYEDVPYGCVGTYVGVDQGLITLDFPGIGLRSVSPYRVDEPALLESPIDVDRFEEGYGDGFEAASEGDRIGRKSQDRIPDDYSRGFVMGWKDYQLGFNRVFSYSAYNDVARKGLFYGKRLAAYALKVLREARPGREYDEDAEVWVDFRNDNLDLVVETFDKRWARQVLDKVLPEAGYAIKERLFSRDFQDLPDVWRIAS